MKHALLATFIMLSSLLAACGSPTASPTPSPKALQAVTLAMGYIPNVQFTPFYVAVERGYFAQEGIQVAFDYGWETDLLKLVGTGELSFAIASGDQVILARAQELPVVYVMNWYRRFPVCVVSLASSGIQGPADLRGKRVGIPATYGASYIGWRALLYSAGLDEADVDLVTIGYTQVESLTTGRVDAALGYAMNEPLQLKQAGQTVDVIYVADYVDLVSNGLITNERTIAQRPELVQGMVRAALKGLRDTIQDPEGAFEICLKYVPEAGGENRETNLAILRESVHFWESDQLGRSDPKAWDTSQQIMRRMGLIDTEMDVNTMFTNRFVETQ